MDFKTFLASGKTLVTDTKVAKPKSEAIKAPKSMTIEPHQSHDPMRNLIRRCADERIKKVDLIAEFKKVIDREEAKL